MIIIKVDQGSEEWFAEKLGIPSASHASEIVKNSGEPSTQRKGYMYTLAAERVTGQREAVYQNKYMQMGVEREGESRAMYELIHGVEVEQVGVVYKDKKRDFLCSPDGIINGEYGLELKNVLPKTQVKYLLNGKIPPEYYSQIQFSLYVTGLQRWDFMSYSPDLPPLIISVEPDDKFVKKLATELEAFCSELDDATHKLEEIVKNEI